MVPLSNSTLYKYNQSRLIQDKRLLCQAPFRNIYFNSYGETAACWLSFFKEKEMCFPNTTIRDVWFGKKFEKLRENIQSNILDFPCAACRKHLEEGNFVNVLAKAYDKNTEITKYPSIMEFELDNTCNLECIMCFGNLSSSIRSHREKKPPLDNHYNDSFIQQLEEFIPYLEEARFNGGEVFLIKQYYKIWENIIKIKPSIKITLATNGTVLNEQIKQLLQKGNFHINFSLDSLQKDCYENIRKNAVFEKTLDNLEYFHGFAKQHKRNLCIVTNPLRNNWTEMPDFVEFANQLDVPLWFNTIIRPEHLSLWALPPDQLLTIFNTLSQYSFKKPLDNEHQKQHNISVYNNLVFTQIKNWLSKAVQPTE